MIRINIHEAKTHLSRYLARLEGGERIVLCRRNVPIAEILPLPRRSAEPRPVGVLAESVELPASFFEPLPEDLVRAFEGGGS